jgi:hypothetical protein
MLGVVFGLWTAWWIWLLVLSVRFLVPSSRWRAIAWLLACQRHVDHDDGSFSPGPVPGRQ